MRIAYEEIDERTPPGRVVRHWDLERDFLTLAPCVTMGGYVRCDYCRDWINGYFLSINHHARQHREKGEAMNSWTKPGNLTANSEN